MKKKHLTPVVPLPRFGNTGYVEDVLYLSDALPTRSSPIKGFGTRKPRDALWLAEQSKSGDGRSDTTSFLHLGTCQNERCFLNSLHVLDPIHNRRGDVFFGNFTLQRFFQTLLDFTDKRYYQNKNFCVTRSIFNVLIKFYHAKLSSRCIKSVFMLY